LLVFRAERAELAAGFQGERAVRLRFRLGENEVVSLDEARSLAQRFIPPDSQPIASRGEESGRPIDQFRSEVLAGLLERGAFGNAEPGVFSVIFTPSGEGRFFGFEIRLGAVS
jgi:hypothetical protein